MSKILLLIYIFLNDRVWYMIKRFISFPDSTLFRKFVGIGMDRNSIVLWADRKNLNCVPGSNSGTNSFIQLFFSRFLFPFPFSPALPPAPGAWSALPWSGRSFPLSGACGWSSWPWTRTLQPSFRLCDKRGLFM